MSDPRKLRYYTRRNLKPNFSDKILRTSVTNQIIIANVIFFIVALLLMLIFGIGFLDYIALKPSDIIQGQNLWTLVTHMFMHHPFFIFHLLFNMLSLFFLGNLMEKIIGRKRYLIFYLLSGLAAAILFVALSAIIGESFIFGTGMDLPAVGASGALFGVAGLLTMLTPNLSLYVMFIPIPIKAKYAVPGLLIVLALIAATAGWPVGNAAHLGGFLAGVFYGAFLRQKYKRKTKMIAEYFSR